MTECKKPKNESAWGAVRRFLHEWPAHIFTVILIAAVTFIAPQQLTLLVYKAALPMIGACGGYWLFRFFVGHEPNFKVHDDRYQLIALMCAGMLAMGLGA